MIEERYLRNRIYLDPDQQNLVKNTNLFLGGAGIGSIIAECALRFGFENIMIVDGDTVEESNLNRQNYRESDIGKYKAESLANYLLQINSKANITYYNGFIDNQNVSKLLEGQHIAINALDFKSDIPFVFDDICQKSNIPVLHPYNFGWGGFLTIVKPDGIPLSQLSKKYHNFELLVAEYAARYSRFWNMPQEWLEEIIEKYKTDETHLPPPQLSIGSWIAAGLCVNAMYNLITEKEVKTFPKFYLSTILSDN